MAIQKKMKARKIPNHAELMSIYDDLMQKPNVHCCYIGRKRTSGKYTSELSIICGVNHKIQKEDLKSKDRIPSSIQWLKESSQPRRLLTDVTETSDKLFYQQTSVVGPGDRVVRLKTNKSASIGIALIHPKYGRVVTTAGHLFPKSGYKNEPVMIYSGDSQFPGTVKKRVMASDADYALIQVSESDSIDNLYQDQELVGPFHMPTEQDINKRVYVLTPGGKFMVTCEGIHGYFSGSGGLMHDLILTTWRTVSGDSGSCLVNRKYAVWGLLVGYTTIQGNTYSAFAPAYVPPTRENAQLL